MNSSTLKFSKDKSCVTYKYNRFKCENSLPHDGKLTFNCIHNECGANIILDHDRRKIMSANLEHMNHSHIVTRFGSNKVMINDHTVDKKVTQDKNISPLKSKLTNKTDSKKTPKQILLDKNKVSNSAKDKDKISNSGKNKVSDSDKNNVSDSDRNQMTNHDHRTRGASHYSDQQEVTHNRDSGDTGQTSNIEVIDQNPDLSCSQVSENSSVANVTIVKSKSALHESSANSKDSAEIMKSVKTVHSSTQTSGNDQLSSETKEHLMKIIVKRDEEIADLKNKIKLLESAFQNSNKHFPKSTSKVVLGMPIHEKGKFKIHIVGDSHVRGLSGKLSLTVPEDCKTEAFFVPGAGFQSIADILRQSPGLIKPEKEDVVVLFCGTNDVCQTEWDVVQSALDELLVSLNNCSLLCVIGVPMRYKKKKLNYHISRLNTKIRAIVENKSGVVSFIDPNKFLKPRDYATDGLHLNNSGKSKLCNRIKHVVGKSFNINHNSNYHCLTVEKSNNNIIDSIECPALIDLTFDNPVYENKCAHNHEESSFCPTSPSYVNMFPSLPHHRSNILNNIEISSVLNSQQSLDSPHTSNHVNQLLIPSETYNSNLYRIAHLSQSSFNQNNVAHSSPIPVIATNQNRPLNENFIPLGQNGAT